MCEFIPTERSDFQMIPPFSLLVRPRGEQTQLCALVCLFVCLDKTRTSILRSLCLEGSNNPWEWLHTDLGTDHVRQSKTAAQTKYVSING